MSRFTKKSVTAAAGFAAVVLSVLFVLPLSGCVLPADDDEPAAARPPAIAYDDPVADSTGLGVVMNVVSTGGPVARYHVEPAPAARVTFDTATGRVAYRLDHGFWNDWEDYLIIAVGPGGADTVTVRLPVNPPPVDMRANVAVQIALRSTNSSALVKASALTLSKLVITLTSNALGDTVIRDTIAASGESGALLSPAASADQVLFRSYKVTPLRSWTVAVKSLDVTGTVIHQGVVTTANLLVGETRAMTLNLSSRYRPHAAMFTFPDSVAMMLGATKQKLSVSRIVMTINGDTVRDTTRASAFTSSPTVHHLAWDYVPADSAHVVGLFVYGDGFGSWPATQPAFGDTFLVTAMGATNVQQLPWLGPAPGGAGPALTVQYGPVNTVVTEVPIDPNPLPRRATGH